MVTNHASLICILVIRVIAISRLRLSEEVWPLIHVRLHC